MTEFREFREFRESENHWSMNWTQFKDPVSHMCLAGAVVASWSLTQEVAGSSPFKDPISHMCLAGAVVASWSLTQEVAGSSPFTVMTNILLLNSANSLKHLGKTPM